MLRQFARQNRIETELDEDFKKGEVNVNEAKLSVALAAEGARNQDTGKEIDETIKKFSA